jgi:hypothetical protein
MSTPDVSTGLEFLQGLFSGIDSGWLELTCISPPEKKLYGPIVGWVPFPLTDRLEKAEAWVSKMNTRGYGVYYALAVRGQKKAPIERVSKRTGRKYYGYPRGKEQDATHITALWADIDEISADAYTRIVHFRPTPSITIFSGGGWHALWLFDKPLAVTVENIADIKAALNGIAKIIHGDQHVTDLARVFRLPGTINTKPGRNGALCQVVDFDTQLTYSFDSFTEYVALGRVQQRPAVTRVLPADVRLPLRRWVIEYIHSGAPEGERNSRLYAATIEFRANGFTRDETDRVLIPRAVADGLDNTEIHRTMESAWRSGKGTNNLPDHLAAIAASDDMGGES